MSMDDRVNSRDFNPIIVIPHHKQTLKKHERISLDQACRIFSDYPICIVKPRSVAKLDGFDEANKNVRFVSLNDKYFKSFLAHQKLLISLEFYKIFKKYSHILIYHLDAYVFRDELAFWCGKEFDYIGAVWFEGWGRSVSADRIFAVGNGGFSLRRTSTCIRILRRLEILRLITRSVSWLIPESKRPIASRHYYQLLKNLRLFKVKGLISIENLVRSPQLHNEDVFWAINVADSFSDFTVARPDDAIKFSFEINPRHLYKLNDKKLPFGCHAFERYDPDFWEEHIRV
jgi:hypothetical protein